MATQVPPPVIVSEPSAEPSRTARWTAWVRLGLVLSWLVLAFAVVTTGEREASLAELQDAILDGDVHVVEVSGLLPPDARGSSLVTLRWETGWGDRVTTVQQVNGRGAVHSVRGDRVVDSDPVDLVQQMGGDVDVVTVPEDHPTLSAELWGLTTPAWIAGAAMATMVAALVALISGSEPWRATRWAWFWLLWVAVPLGLLAFAALSGPTRGIAPPTSARRVTGGVAFLVALVANSVITSIVATSSF